MADTKASAETNASAFADADGWAIVQSGNDRFATALQMWTYIQGKAGGADVMVLKGVIDCSTNPNYPAADAGHVYIVSVAGKIGGGSGPDVEVGDRLVCITDSTSSGTHGAVGANWYIGQANIVGAAVTTGHLGQFAATTSAQLAGVLSDEEGTGALIFGRNVESICLPCSDENTTAIVAANGVLTFRMPYAFTLTEVRASLTTAQATSGGGGIVTVDIHEAGTSVLSTKITLDNTEKSSLSAATQPVISDSAISNDAEITIDIDQVGDGTAKGLKVYMIGRRA